MGPGSPSCRDDPRQHSTRSQALPPPFRWPGGKRWLLPHLLALVPGTFGRYFEPFLGGGAMFFALRPKHSSLSDTNADLIAFYRAVRDDWRGVADALTKMPQDADHYYEVRRSAPKSAAECAARFLYLTTLSFNGIFRVDREGRFNTPFGHRPNSLLQSVDYLQRYSNALDGAELKAVDFEEACADAVTGDLVYFDPPYRMPGASLVHVRYNGNPFSWNDQTRLAQVANSLVDRGCHVIVSNAWDQSISDLYRGFEAMEITRRSSVAATLAGRGQVKEYLFVGRSSAGHAGITKSGDGSRLTKG